MMIFFSGKKIVWSPYWMLIIIEMFGTIVVYIKGFLQRMSYLLRKLYRTKERRTRAFVKLFTKRRLQNCGNNFQSDEQTRTFIMKHILYNWYFIVFFSTFIRFISNVNNTILRSARWHCRWNLLVSAQTLINFKKNTTRRDFKMCFIYFF